MSHSCPDADSVGHASPSRTLARFRSSTADRRPFPGDGNIRCVLLSLIFFDYLTYKAYPWTKDPWCRSTRCFVVDRNLPYGKMIFCPQQCCSRIEVTEPSPARFHRARARNAVAFAAIRHCTGNCTYANLPNHTFSRSCTLLSFPMLI